MDATTLRACERDSVGFGCSVDKRSLAATLGSSGSANVLSGRPSEKERERARPRETKRNVCEIVIAIVRRYAKQPNLVDTVGEKKNRA